MNGIVVSTFLMGLFGGVHCVAMCGGVVGVLCSAGASKGRFALAYNAGRIASYAALGFLFGGLGTLSVGIVPLDAARYALRGIAAITMLAVGMHLLGLPMLVKRIESVGGPVWRRVGPIAKRFVPLRSATQAAVAGALWGFLPCGLLYAAFALAAASESPWVGAGAMASFGLGTLPVLLTMGIFADRVKKQVGRAWVRKTAGAAILAFGIYGSAGLARQVGLTSVLGLEPHRSCCPVRH